VQPSAREAWTSYLEENPGSFDPSIFSIHDCPDGRIPPSDEHDPSSSAWPANDGNNILGTPYGSPEFVEEYLQNKLRKHEQFLSFITDLSKMGFSRESHKMLIGYVVPRLTHIAKSVPRDAASTEWMKAVDDAHLSTWLDCTGATSLGYAMSAHERELLSSSLDLPPQVGGIGMQSLIKATNEELLGSWASVTPNLVSFLRSKGLPIYDKLANALDAMADEDEDPSSHVIPAVSSLPEVSAIAQCYISDIAVAELDFVASLILGERIVEIRGRFTSLEPSTKPDPVKLP